MNRNLALLITTLATVIVATSIVRADTAVIPAAFTNLEGSLGTVSILNAGPRTYQYLIEHSLLAAVPDNAILTGIAFRLNNEGDTEAKTFTDFEIYLGVASTTDATVSNVFADNIVGGNAGRTLVRDGSLSLSASFFPTGNTGTTPNAFAEAFGFNVASYTYDKDAGNGLIIEIRQTGAGGNSLSLDSEPNTNIAGGTNRIATSFDATVANVTGSFIIPQLQFTVVPEANTGLLAALALPVAGLLVARRRKG